MTNHVHKTGSITCLDSDTTTRIFDESIPFAANHTNDRLPGCHIGLNLRWNN